jgi:hypothetical protein
MGHELSAKLLLPPSLPSPLQMLPVAMVALLAAVLLPLLVVTRT